MSNGWDESAVAWIASQGEEGDYGRRFVLDRPMLERAVATGARRGLDVGCGEGRFCRMLAERGVACAGIDFSAPLIDEARRLHPEGEYAVASAEALPFADASFELVVSYLALIDIPDVAAAIAEMARVLAPGGRLLIANINSFYTAANPKGWTKDADGADRFVIDRYMEERVDWVGWRGIRIRNWHRPMSTYMRLLLGAGLVLRHYDEPLPYGGDTGQAAMVARVPGFVVMEWEKAA